MRRYFPFYKFLDRYTHSQLPDLIRPFLILLLCVRSSQSNKVVYPEGLGPLPPPQPFRMSQAPPSGLVVCRIDSESPLMLASDKTRSALGPYVPTLVCFGFILIGSARKNKRVFFYRVSVEMYG